MTSRARTTVRKARSGDADVLTRIAHAAKRHWGYSERLMRLWKSDLTVTSDAIARDVVFCAVRGGEIVGFYAIWCDRKRAELEHMWVEPRHIGSGVGHKLFAHLLGRLRTMRVERLEITSDPNAEGFYLRMGARRVGSIVSRPRGRCLPLLVMRVDR